MSFGRDVRCRAVHPLPNRPRWQPDGSRLRRRGDLVPAGAWDALTYRVVTVYLGAPHRSSAVHEAVAERLSPVDGTSLFARLRLSAHDAAAALVAGDLEAYDEQ